MPSATGLYLPRRPELTALHRLVSENLASFFDIYDERFLERYGPLTERARRTLRAFLECGLPEYGFARIRCDDCHEERVLAFSCQFRGVCPSCNAKRMEVWSRFMLDDVVEDVPHRQYVFVIPRLLRRHFTHDAASLSALCQAAAASVGLFCQTGLDRPEAELGLVVSVQLFGDAVNLHLHMVATDGAFDGEGFHHLPVGTDDTRCLEELFAARVLDYLVAAERLTPHFREQLLSWRHTGFSVDASVRIPLGDDQALGRLLRYVARPPISNERIAYDAQQGRVTIFSAKSTGGTRRIVATSDPLEFLAQLVQQVPPVGTHLIRYYSYYSTRQRAARREEDPAPSVAAAADPAPNAKNRRRRWALLLRLVFEVDPLACPSCGKAMRLVAFITATQPELIDRILDHLHHPRAPPPKSGRPGWLEARLAQDYHRANPDLLPPEDDVQRHPSDDDYVRDEIYPD